MQDDTLTIDISPAAAQSELCAARRHETVHRVGSCKA
jgi:hypothetical protein